MESRAAIIREYSTEGQEEGKGRPKGMGDINLWLLRLILLRTPSTANLTNFSGRVPAPL